MFKRNKNDKGKQSQQTRMKISQKLKAKAKSIRKQGSTMARKGIIKGSGVAGYAAGRVGTEIATRPNVSKVVGRAAEGISNVVSKIPKGKMTDKSKLPKLSARNQLTAARATGAFIGGSTKGAADGLSAAEKRKRK
jgi:hypothetical protein